MVIFGRPFLRNWTPPASIKHMGIEYDPGCKKSCHYPKCQMECIKNLKTDLVMEKIIWQMDKILGGKLGREVG